MMSRSFLVRAHRARALVSVVLCASGAWGLAACSNSNGGGASTGEASGSAEANSGSDNGSGSGDGTGSPSGSGGGASGTAGGGTDGGAEADASPRQDAGAAPRGSVDGGPRDIGSCCSPQTTPGCGDPNLELCICQMDPDCCTTAWSLACALLVQQKYCQPGVRSCVCGTNVDAGQWAQTDCCSNDWDTTCDSVATLKCSAVQGCF